MGKTNLFMVIAIAAIVVAVVGVAGARFSGFATSCGDTDGINLGVKSGSDLCQGTNSVKEYYCVGSNLKNYVASCPSGTECSNGACVVVVKPLECKEDDGGRVYDKKGITVQYKNGAVHGTYNDRCESSKKIREFYCNGDLATNALVDCPSGTVCNEGACSVPALSCSEDDGGDNKDVRGTTIQYKNGNVDITHKDRCEAENIDAEQKVREFYCNNNLVTSRLVSCGQEGACSNGKCIYPVGSGCVGQQQDCEEPLYGFPGNCIQGCNAPTQGVWHCSGTPYPCSTFNSEDYCESSTVLGCVWKG